MKRLLALALGVLLPVELSAATTVTISNGTPIYGILEETVTSRKKDSAEGDIVRASVWRDVIVDGETVIEAGEPLVVRIASVKRAKIAGRKGDLELEAVSTRTVDGSDILLSGGYDKSGKGRKALSVTLFAVVAWPLIFIKGKQAELPSGTVFDATVQKDGIVTIEKPDAGSPVRVKLGHLAPRLVVDPLYDEMDESGEDPSLPIRLELCNAERLASAGVVTVNEGEIPRLDIPLGEINETDGCFGGRGTVDLKQLGKHFVRGINRFEIEAGGQRAEIVMDVEL
jgi:hypothetical protein